MKVIRKNHHKDPKLFDQFGDVFDVLGIDSMSGDETDNESPQPPPKRTRRVSLPWLHDDIVGMKRSLEKLDEPNRMCRLKRGNPGCVRLATAIKVDNSR